MKTSNIFKDIEIQLNLNKGDVEKVFSSLVKFMKYTIQNFYLECLTKEDDFKNFRHSFNLKYLGKFCINIKKFKYINKWKK